ncbi:MAG: hypothetical protein QM723_05335 [Myxococcaceae bacterium]
MSSVYARGKWLYLSVKNADGQWERIRTDFVVGQEEQARALLETVETRRDAGEDVGELGPISVAGWSKKWLKRRELEVQTWKNDRATLHLHVLPKLGAMRLDQVRARHVVDLVKGWRARDGDQRMAPRTIYTAYSTVCAMFRDAQLDGLINATPCVLTKRQLGPKVDGDPEFRSKAVFSVAELESMISDTAIPMDRRTMYGLQGVGGLRHGEAAGLLWRNVRQAELVPYMLVAFSYERPLPKGGIVRPVPMHPTLAAMLAEWRLHGWREMFGRAPTDDDLVVPLPPGARTKRRWRGRSKGYSVRSPRGGPRGPHLSTPPRPRPPPHIHLARALARRREGHSAPGNPPPADRGDRGVHHVRSRGGGGRGEQAAGAASRRERGGSPVGDRRRRRPRPPWGGSSGHRGHSIERCGHGGHDYERQHGVVFRVHQARNGCDLRRRPQRRLARRFGRKLFPSFSPRIARARGRG